MNALDNSVCYPGFAFHPVLYFCLFLSAAWRQIQIHGNKVLNLES